MHGFGYQVISLLPEEVKGTGLRQTDIPEMEKLCEFVQASGISTMVYCGLREKNIQDEKKYGQLRKCAFSSILTGVRQIEYFDRISHAFESAEIDYMPLKGLVLKRIYPKPEYREMGDIDILVRNEQYSKVKSVLLELNMIEGSISDYEHVWKTKDGIHIEIHTRLVSRDNDDFYSYYGDGWHFAVLETGHRYAMKPEDLFVFLFVHYTKHFRNSGIGIRHLIDLRMCRIFYSQMDEAYIQRQMQEMQLIEFYKNVMRSIDVLFCCIDSDDITDIILANAFESEAFGTKDMILQGASAREAQLYGDSRIMYLIHTIFPAYRIMIRKYDILLKFPILLPYYWIVRWLDVLFRKQSAIHNVSKIASQINGKGAKEWKDKLRRVGLHYFRGKL